MQDQPRTRPRITRTREIQEKDEVVGAMDHQKAGFKSSRPKPNSLNLYDRARA